MGSSVTTLDSSHQFCLSVPRSNQGHVRDLAQVWQGSLWEGWQTDPSLLLEETSPAFPRDTADWGTRHQGEGWCLGLYRSLSFNHGDNTLRWELSPVSQMKTEKLSTLPRM